MDHVRCIVKGCVNHKDEGKFVGDLCNPCYMMLTTGSISSGHTFIHDLLHDLLGWKQAARTLLTKGQLKNEPTDASFP